MKLMPVGFVSHGAPVSVEDTEWMSQLLRWGRSLANVQSILVLSAHWVTSELAIGPLVATPLIYDFFGFPERFYRMTYRALPAPDLARSIESQVGLGNIVGMAVRGLDHGMWVPLSGMFPSGNIKVLGMSLPGLDPRRLYALGKALAPLRAQGVLILASGGITHNLFELDPDPLAAPFKWAVEFDRWIEDALKTGNMEAVLDFERKGPDPSRAHPSTEHLAPLFVALGAAEGDAHVTCPVEGFRWGSLSLRSFLFEP